MGEQQSLRSRSNGTCSFCKGEFAKAAISRHLRSCRERGAVERAPDQGTRKIKLFHLLVEGRRRPEYWMHLEARGDAMLRDLDGFLRDIWLECCGHLSAFTIREDRFVSEFFDGPRLFDDFEVEEHDMYVSLEEVLTGGLRFYHEYDFGTTTELALRVVSEKEGTAEGGQIRLLARNNPPPIQCESCGELATWVCAQCIYEGGGWLCDKCSEEHECGEEMLLPVVNSPRVGMCGYEG